MLRHIPCNLLQFLLSSGNAGFGELDDLTGIEAAVAGQHKADHANQRKQIEIGAAEHFNAQHNGGKGRIGGTAEQAHQTQCRCNARVKSQKAAQNAAKGSADAEGGYDLAAFKACGKSHGSKQQLQQEGIPVLPQLPVPCPYRHR